MATSKNIPSSWHLSRVNQNVQNITLMVFLAMTVMMIEEMVKEIKEDMAEEMIDGMTTEAIIMGKTRTTVLKEIEMIDMEAEMTKVKTMATKIEEEITHKIRTEDLKITEIIQKINKGKEGKVILMIEVVGIK